MSSVFVPNGKRHKGSDAHSWCISPAQAAELQEAGSVYLKLLISNAAAGVLIGKGGSDLPTVEAQTGCRIKISQMHAVYPGTSARVVAIAGEPDSLETGLCAMVEACRHAAEIATERGDSEPTGIQTFIQVAIPNTSCGLVLGKQGCVQKELSQRLGIPIQISKYGENSLSNERIVTVSGSADSVAAAVCEISSLIQGDASLAEQLQTPAQGDVSQPPQHVPALIKPPPRPAAPPTMSSSKTSFTWGGKDAWSGADGTSSSDRQCTIYFEVTDMEAGHIIGKGGSFQQTVQQQTGAKIELSKKGEYVPGTTNRQATIRGPMRAVHAAHAMVLERAAEVVAN